MKLERLIAQAIIDKEGKALTSIAERSTAGYERVSSYIAGYRAAIVADGAKLHQVVMEINSLATEPQVPQKKKCW